MQNEKIAAAVAEINHRLKVLRSALFDAVAQGNQSAAVSNSGASSSYTKMTLLDMRTAIADLERAKQALLRRGRRTSIAPNFTYPVN